MIFPWKGHRSSILLFWYVSKDLVFCYNIEMDKSDVIRKENIELGLLNVYKHNPNKKEL